MSHSNIVSLAHGFWSADHGEKTLHRLIPWFEAQGTTVLQFNYGWVGRLGVRLLTDKFGNILAGMAWEGSTFIGYSNGNYIGHRAMEKYGAPFKRWIAIAPALDNDIEIPPQVESMLVVASRHDWPTRIASWIPFSGWGDMGYAGYQGEPDSRVTTIFTEDILPEGEWDKIGHGGHFRIAVLEHLAPILIHFHRHGELPDGVPTQAQTGS